MDDILDGYNYLFANRGINRTCISSDELIASDTSSVRLWRLTDEKYEFNIILVCTVVNSVAFGA
jgi:hypothetical protein